MHAAARMRRMGRRARVVVRVHRARRKRRRKRLDEERRGHEGEERLPDGVAPVLPRVVPRDDFALIGKRLRLAVHAVGESEDADHEVEQEPEEEDGKANLRRGWMVLREDAGEGSGW
eukprot:2818377-Rhodomonas_salina.1